MLRICLVREICVQFTKSVRIVVTALLEYIDLSIKIYLSNQGRCPDIGGPDMGGLTVIKW